MKSANEIQLVAGTCTCGSNVRRADDSGTRPTCTNSRKLGPTFRARSTERIIVCPERAILLPGDHVTNGSRKRGGIFHAVYSSVFLPPHTIILQPDDN